MTEFKSKLSPPFRSDFCYLQSTFVLVLLFIYVFIIQYKKRRFIYPTSTSCMFIWYCFSSLWLLLMHKMQVFLIANSIHSLLSLYVISLFHSPGPWIRYRARLDLVGSDHPTKSGLRNPMKSLGSDFFVGFRWISSDLVGQSDEIRSNQTLRILSDSTTRIPL
jgi:hypothetical protein